VVTYGRRSLFSKPENIDLLRGAFREVMANHPFTIEAIVILPDHLHAVWTLPRGDSSYSTRWRLIKSAFSRRCRTGDGGRISASRQSKGERAIWQRRFWEHQIRDEQDFIHHVEYIHYNPVKHGWATSATAWAYSSFRRYVRAGLYPADWGTIEAPVFPAGVGQE
jgi:putative transposase